MLETNPTLADFNSFASIEDLKYFAEERDIPLPKKLKPLLIRAMDFLSTLRWIGEYPPKRVSDDLIKAQCMLAVEAISGDLLPAIREAQIKSERVDVLTTTYAIADDVAFTPSYPAVMALLSDYISLSKFAINAQARRS